MILECDANFEEKLTCGLKIGMKNLENFHQNTQSLKIGTFIRSFYTKSKMYNLKTYRRVILYDIEERCKIWKGIFLLVPNLREEFNKFWSEPSKISKICTLVDCFWPKYIMFELKKYRSVMFNSTEYWSKKLKENWLVLSKLTWGIYQIFTRVRSKV